MKKIILLFSLFFCVLLGRAQEKELDFYYSQPNKSSYESGHRIDNAEEAVNGVGVNEFLVIDSLGVAYPEQVSFDGRYVVGASGYSAFLWDLNTPSLTRLSADKPKEKTEAFDVNTLGMVAGHFRDPNYTINIADWEGEDGFEPGDGVVRPVPITVAGVWQNGSWRSLGIGTLNLSSLTHYEYGSQATSISADGKVAGGFLDPGNVLTPCIWTYNEGDDEWVFTAYSYPTPSSQGAKIQGISGDGSIACGWVADQWGGRQPIVWKSPTEYIVLGTAGECSRVSENGKYIALDVNDRPALYSVEDGTLEILNAYPDAGQARLVSVTNDKMAIGWAQFGNFFTGFKRSAFVHSESLGTIDMFDFIKTFAPEVVVPEFMTFDPNEGLFRVATGVSDDVRVITGWTGTSAQSRLPWVLKLAEKIKVYNKPSDLVATVSNRNQVNLVWNAPEVDPLQELNGYKIYRDGEQIASVANIVLTYDDECPVGAHTYQVSGVYPDGDSPLSNTVYVSIVDTYELPFFEDFAAGDFTTNYWTALPESTHWSINPFFQTGLDGVGVTHMNPTGDYDEAMVSKPLDAAGKETVYLTFALKYQTEATDKHQDTLSVEVYNGAAWISVGKYPAKTINPGWSSENIDISAVAANKLFQVRFHVYGKGETYNTLDIDNIRVDLVKEQSAPSAIQGEIKGDVTNLIWANPSGAYELSYEQTPIMTSTGNEGAPFIAAISFEPEDLVEYKGLYLTAVSAYIDQHQMDQSMTLALVVFDGDTRIDQTISSFAPRSWNSFRLDNPILIDGTKRLRFGINVVSHSEYERPIGCDDALIPAERKGNIYSTDDGETWEVLSTASLTCNWSIAGLLDKSATSSSAFNKEEKLYYNIYRNGVKVNKELVYAPRYVDANGEQACYVVDAYRGDTGVLLAKSGQFCPQPTSLNGNKADRGNLTVYPNPANDVINISGEYTKATLMNLNGQVVLVSTQNPIRVADLVEGVYFLEIVTESGIITEKVMIKK